MTYLNSVRNRIDKLNKKVDEERREKVETILNRFGLQLDDGSKRRETRRLFEYMMKSISVPEQNFIYDYLIDDETVWKDWFDEQKPFLDWVIPNIICNFIENHVWPKLIDYSTDLENDLTHTSFDFNWIAMKDPELNKAFFEEISRPEANIPYHRIPDWMV